MLLIYEGILTPIHLPAQQANTKRGNKEKQRMSTITTKKHRFISMTRVGDRPWFSATAGHLSADAFEDQMFFLASPGYLVSRMPSRPWPFRASPGIATTWIPRLELT